MTKTRRENVVAARELAAAKDWHGVRALLAPADGGQPAGVLLFLLARAEYELGNPAAAEPLVERFCQQRPGHAGALLLTARVKLATGDLDAAESAARAGAELARNDKPYLKVLDRIAAARDEEYDPAADLETIDAAFPEARISPSPEVRAATERVRRVVPDADWPNDVAQAKIAYFHHAPDVDAALRNYDPDLIDVSVRFGYLTWPRRIQEHVRGRKVLDVGCGFGGFGMGFLVAGATSYSGLDPAMDLDSTRAKDKRRRAWDDMGVTPRQIADALPAIRLFQSSSEDLAFDETFDTIALHNVTEHLMQLEEVIGGLVRLCKPDTHLVFHHHNYYCWNGHHLAPNQPAQLDESNPKQQLVFDWRHITAVPELPKDHYILNNLNRVRLDELRDITERYFEIVRWNEVLSSKPTLARLTPEIVDRVREAVPDITERELTVNAVLCVARPKS